MLPGKLPAVYEVLGIGSHELCDEHGAARVHAGAQELHHMDIPAVLEDGDLQQPESTSSCTAHSFTALNGTEQNCSTWHVLQHDDLQQHSRRAVLLSKVTPPASLESTDF